MNLSVCCFYPIKKLIAINSNITSDEDVCKTQLIMIEELDNMIEKAISIGYSTSTVQSARFALCAYIDEVINLVWPHNRINKISSLQEYYYNTTNAGEKFFLRLNYLLEHPDASLRIYYLMLKLGYRGKYILDSGKELSITTKCVERVLEGIFTNGESN